MITGGDLTPEERRKLFRTYRFSAITQLVAGMVWLGTGTYAALAHAWHGTIPSYAALGLGAAFLLVAPWTWRRSRKYAGAPTSR